jgi:charged multivesicular body protein 7
VKAWRRALERATWDGCIATGSSGPNHLIIPVDDRLDGALEHRQFGRPLALGTVVREAVSEKTLLPLGDFLGSKESIYYRPWTELTRNLAGWVLGQVWPVNGAKGEDRLPGGEFVVIRNVELVAKSLANYAVAAKSPFDLIFSRASFYRSFREGLVAGKSLSDADLHVLLLFSSRDKKLLSYDGKVVKFHSGATGDKPGITEEDAAIASLKELVDGIKHQVTVLVERVGTLNMVAKEAILRKDRVSALAALRSKKITETALEQRHATLSQLEQVSAKIEEAADHVQLVKVLECSAEVLKSLNLKVGGAERVEEAMAHLREQMSEVDDVGNIIATGALEPVVDEAEVDDELEAMTSEEKRKAEGASVSALLEKIPAAPQAECERIGEESVGEETGSRDASTAAATEGVRKLSLVDREQGQPMAG